MASGSGSNSGSSSQYIPEASGSSSRIDPIASTSNSLESISISTSTSSSFHSTLQPIPSTKSKKKSTTTSSSSNGTNSKGKGKSKSSLTTTTFDRNCEAITRFDEECTSLVFNGNSSSSSNGTGKATSHSSGTGYHWCNLHDIEEKLVRTEFMRCTAEIKVFTLPYCIPTSKINSTEDLDELEVWESTTRSKWDIVDKAIRTASYHSIHFVAAETLEGYLDMDELESLEKLLSSNLTRLIKKSHACILESEDALWLLSPSSPTTPSYPPCTSNSNPNNSNSPSSPTPCAPLLQAEYEEPDPVSAVEKMKRAEILESLSLSGSHASFIKDGRKSVERVRIVECLFRRLISRDEELLVKAYRCGLDHVLRFFEDTKSCSLSSLTRLHKALQATSVLSIREAVLDAFRAIKWEESGDTGDTEDGEEGVGLQLIGGWTYKLGFLKREMTTREWEHVYDLCGCPGCAIRVCSTFNEWTKFRRLTVVSHGTKPPPFLHWGNQKESDACRIFRALDIIKCSEERSGSESEVRKVGVVGTKGKGLFVERQERNWLFLKMSITHPKAIPILTALSNAHSVIVRSRLTPSIPLEAFPIPPPSHLWYSRHRSAPSKADLRHLSFQTDPAGFGLGNSDPTLILNSLDNLDSPEKIQGMEVFKNTYEILVMDGFGREGEGTGFTAISNVLRSFEQFENEVSQLILVGAKILDVKKALEWGESESYRKGDLLFDFGKKVSNVDKELSTIEKAVRAVVEGGGMNSLLPSIKIDTTTLGVTSGGKKKKKEKVVEGAAAVLESLRDDALAFKLSRSLFR